MDILDKVLDASIIDRERPDMDDGIIHSGSHVTAFHEGVEYEIHPYEGKDLVDPFLEEIISIYESGERAVKNGIASGRVSCSLRDLLSLRYGFTKAEHVGTYTGEGVMHVYLLDKAKRIGSVESAGIGYSVHVHGGRFYLSIHEGLDEKDAEFMASVVAKAMRGR